MSARRMWTWLVVGGMLGLWVGTASAGLPPQAIEERSMAVDGALRKLGRGIANIATCPVELLRTPELVGQRDGYTAALTVGVLQGLWRTVLRGLGGVFEIVTFYAEIPEGYDPLIMPEFVFGSPSD